jgi:hypothetical protein
MRLGKMEVPEVGLSAGAEKPMEEKLERKTAQLRREGRLYFALHRHSLRQMLITNGRALQLASNHFIQRDKRRKVQTDVVFGYFSYVLNQMAHNISLISL